MASGLVEPLLGHDGRQFARLVDHRRAWESGPGRSADGGRRTPTAIAAREHPEIGAEALCRGAEWRPPPGPGQPLWRCSGDEDPVRSADLENEASCSPWEHKSSVARRIGSQVLADPDQRRNGDLGDGWRRLIESDVPILSRARDELTEHLSHR